MRRLHVTGCHRSGTTLALELLASCYAVDGACALEMSVFREPDLPWRDPATGRRTLFVSKKPRDVRVLAPVLDADPDLWVLHLVRDPRAVITSVHRAFPGRYFTTLAAWLECDAAARALAGHPRFHELCYEDLVADPAAAQAAIERAFGFLERRHAFADYARVARGAPPSAEAMGGVRPVAADRVDAWRAHLERVKGQHLRTRGLPAALVARGYEPDDTWLELLEGVEPERGPSRTADREPLWRRFDRRLRDGRRLRRKLGAIAARPRT